MNIKKMFEFIGEDPNRLEIKETPERVANMSKEIFSGYGIDPSKVLHPCLPFETDQLVMLKDISFASYCEHHLLPFYGHVHIGYIPNQNIVGLSKLIELVDALSKRLQIQERLTKEISDQMNQALQPQGTIVLIEASHMCVSHRGNKKEGTKTTTRICRGAFQQDSSLRQEFLTLLKT